MQGRGAGGPRCGAQSVFPVCPPRSTLAIQPLRPLGPSRRPRATHRAVLAQRPTVCWVVCELLSAGATGAPRTVPRPGSRRPRQAVQTATPGPALQVLGQHLTFLRLQLPHFTRTGLQRSRPPQEPPAEQSSCLWRDGQQGAGSLREAGCTGCRRTLTAGVYTRDVREALALDPEAAARLAVGAGGRSSPREFGFNQVQVCFHHQHHGVWGLGLQDSLG